MDNLLLSFLLSVISVLTGFVSWYVVQIFKKTEKVDDKITRNTQKITTLREHINENLSEIYSSQRDIGRELISLRGAVESGNLVLERRQAEIDRLKNDSDWAKSRLEEITEVSRKQTQLLGKHQGEILDLKNGYLLIKNKKDKNGTRED